MRRKIKNLINSMNPSRIKVNKVSMYIVSLIFITLSTLFGLLIDTLLNLRGLFTTLFFIFSSFQTLFGLSIIVRVIIKVLNAKPLEAELLELQKLNNKEGQSESSASLKNKIEFVRMLFNNLKNEIGYEEDIELMLVDSLSVNAISLGRFKHSHKICLTKGSLEKLEERELKALLYHELFHIVNLDTDYLTTISGTFASPMLFFTLSKNTLKNLYRIKNKITPSEYYKRFFSALFILLTSILFLPLTFLTNMFVSVSKEFDADNFSLQKVGKDELLSLFEKVKLNCVSFESNYFFMKTLFFSHPNCKDLSKKMNRIFDTYPSLEERIELVKSKVANVSNVNTKDIT